MSGDKPDEQRVVTQAMIDAARASLERMASICKPEEHDFQGWREFRDGRGGETVCTKCGMGAVAFSLRYGP